MKNLFLLLVVVCCSLLANAQVNLDSLKTVWQDTELDDTVRLKALMKISWDGYLFRDPDSAFFYADLLYQYANEKNLERYKGAARNTQGASFYLKSNYAKAIEYYLLSLKIQEAIGNLNGAADALNNIGSIYLEQNNYEFALDYYERSLSLKLDAGDTKGAAIIMGNIALIHHDEDRFQKALDYNERALKIHKEVDNVNGIANTYSNLGLIYSDQNEKDKALEYQKKSLAAFRSIGDKNGMANSLINCAMLYRDMQAHEDARDACKQALVLGEELGSISITKDACNCLYKAHKSLGNGVRALEYHERVLALTDSLRMIETSEKLQEMEFEKAMLQDSIVKAEKARLIEETHQKDLREKKRVRNIFGGVGFFALLLAGGFYWRWRYVRNSKAVLQVEKDKSENLLLNILPEEIAEELKEKGRADARDFEKVSILFTDFKGFTAASERLSAQELVSEINTCFEAFDGIMAKYGIEKIKTIGDAYMAAGGLPVPTDNSVRNTVLAALEMQDFIRNRKAKLDAEGKSGFEMRVGVHTGPVVAGIVGVKKFQYDIWGDTVNTASRMESSGEVGKVNISEATYEMLKDDAQFSFESRGKVEAKGKGEMEMYFVEPVV